MVARATDEIVHGSDRFDLTYRVKLPEITGTARLWLPFARTGDFQTVKIVRISAPITWHKIKDQTGANDLVALSPTPSESGKLVEIEYTVERREKESYANGTKPDQYLQPERLVPQNETFRTIAQEVVQQQTDDLARGRALYDHVLQRMRYDKSSTSWGRGDAVYACDARTGNCTYFIALARSVGVPVRFAIGATIPADRSDGLITGYHCWAEFFANGRWVPVDISEASKSQSLADYYFGHHPTNRVELSLGRNHAVDPAPASGPINFLVFPLLEIGGEPVKAETEFAFRRLPH